ncbi:MAG: MFS transporter [Pseudomonadota bacterium]
MTDTSNRAPTTVTAAAPRHSLAPIYAANMVCSMGMMGFVAAAGPLAASLGLEAWQIGLSATAGGLGWVLAARFWGKTADRTGRKPVLLIGLSGFIAGYFLLCLGVVAGVRWEVPALYVLGVLVATRFGMGLSYSAVPAAGAAVIADRFAPDDRAGAMGRLGAAQASGLLFGPAAVALLAGESPATVLFLLALLPIPALAFAAIALPKDAPKAAAATGQLPLADARLIRPVLVAMLAMMAVGIAQIVIGFVAMDRLALPESSAMRLAGGALAAVGVSLVVAQLTVKRLGWSPAVLMRVGSGMAALGLLAAAFAPSEVTLVLSYAFSGFGAGWAFPGINAYAANAVSSEEQGRAAGAVSSAMGVGAMLGPTIGGAFYQQSGAASYLIAAAVFAAAALIVRK